MKYTTDNPPVPISPDRITDHIDTEVWDRHVPRGGFLEDFVMGTRGIETPTKFAVWAGLFSLSALLKRDAYLKWYPRPLYPNLFIIFVAPPRICAKSTCVDIGDDITQLVPDYISDKLIREGKRVKTHHSKVTPEMLFDIMAPGKRKDVKMSEDDEETLSDPSIDYSGEAEEYVETVMENFRNNKVIDGDGDEILELEQYSELSLNISELTTFLGRQKYTEHLVDVLTYFYDCPERADEATRTYGSKSLRKVYLTFFGATTPDSFNKSLPETAFGGGFLSRTILIASYLPTRYYPIPSLLHGAPGKQELAERLAWVAEHAQGEYEMTKDAYKEYTDWYRPFKDSLVGDPLGDARARTDTNLLKLCVLIRAQRYEPGRYITRQDFLDAKFLLEDAFESAKELYSGANGSEYYSLLVMITKYLQKFGTVDRAQLLREFTMKKITPELLTNILEHLLQSEQIRVTFNGKAQETISGHPREKIHFIEQGELPYD